MEMNDESDCQVSVSPVAYQARKGCSYWVFRNAPRKGRFDPHPLPLPFSHYPEEGTGIDGVEDREVLPGFVLLGLR